MVFKFFKQNGFSSFLIKMVIIQLVFHGDTDRMCVLYECVSLI